MLETALRKDSSFFDFTKPAEMLLGDSIATNMMMMGYAYQKGLLPLAAKSIEQAIEGGGSEQARAGPGDMQYRQVVSSRTSHHGAMLRAFLGRRIGRSADS